MPADADWVAFGPVAVPTLLEPAPNPVGDTRRWTPRPKVGPATRWLGYQVEVVGIWVPASDVTATTESPVWVVEGRAGLDVIQAWQTCILVDGTIAHIDARWHPSTGFAWSLRGGSLETTDRELRKVLRARRLLMGNRRPTAATEARMASSMELARSAHRLKTQGLTQSAIAEELGIGDRQVRRLLKVDISTRAM